MYTSPPGKQIFCIVSKAWEICLTRGNKRDMQTPWETKSLWLLSTHKNYCLCESSGCSQYTPVLSSEHRKLILGALSWAYVHLLMYLSQRLPSYCEKHSSLIRFLDERYTCKQPQRSCHGLSSKPNILLPGVGWSNFQFHTTCEFKDKAQVLTNRYPVFCYLSPMFTANIF